MRALETAVEGGKLMKTVLGYDVADDWEEYFLHPGAADVCKWWQCPLCHGEYILPIPLYCWPNELWPPLSPLECPSCKRESEIPWPTPPMVTYTCQRCGMVDMVSRLAWHSPDKTCIHLDWQDGRFKTTSGRFCCSACYLPAGAGLGISDLIGNAWVSIFGGTLGEAYTDRKQRINRDRLRVGEFLSRVPALRAEKTRMAEEEKRELLAKAKKRETVAGLKSMDPADFESAVGSLYQALGYKAQLTPGSGDQGIDIVLTKDEVRIAVQCKRYGRVVPISHVREFYGSFMGEFSRGVFVTSATFSRNTYAWAEERKDLELVDGTQLAKLFIEHKPEIIPKLDKLEQSTPTRKVSDSRYWEVMTWPADVLGISGVEDHGCGEPEGEH